MTPTTVPEDPSSPNVITRDEIPGLVGASSTDEVPTNASESAADGFEGNIARPRPDSENFISRLNERTNWRATHHASSLRPTDSVNDIPPARVSDVIHTPTSPAISDTSKNTARDTQEGILPSFDRLGLMEEFMAIESLKSAAVHKLFTQGFPSSMSKSNTDNRNRASEDNNTTLNTEPAPAPTQKPDTESPPTSSKLEMLPQELRDQIYPDVATNFKEDILPHGWQETDRPWKSRRKTVQPTHYDGPGHYVKRSYFKAKFASGDVAPPREEHTVPPHKAPRTARHNRDRQYGVKYGGKDAEKHKSENHQQFVSPRMAVGGYKILMLGNKSFAAEVSAYVFEEMQVNAKRRQDYGDANIEYKSDDMRAYFEKHPEYTAHTKKLIILVNLGQAMTTYEALVAIFQPFENLQDVLIKVFFAGLWRDSLAPSVEKFRDLLVLKRGFERTGYVAEDGTFLKDRTAKFKFEHSVAQRFGQRLTDDEKAAMEERYQKRWEAVTREWNGIGSHLD